MVIKYYLILVLLQLPLSLKAASIMSGQHSFEFHGYFRGGLGFSEGGATQARFQAPGTRAAYRLGNEPDTNLELQFNYKYNLSKLDKENVEGIIMIDGYKSHGQSSDFTVDNLAQAYLSFNQFFKSDAKLWLGRRYYYRMDIHILDHTWLNSGQGAHVGLGVEDMLVGKYDLDIALFRYEDTFTSGVTSYLINSTALDFRLGNIDISHNSKLTIWAGLTARHKLKALNYDSKSGYGLGGWVDSTFSKMKNSTVLLYQSGAAITQGDYNARPIRENNGVGWNLDDATMLEISNTLTYESLPDYSFQWTALYRQEDHGLATNSKINWLSTGIRPVFYFSKHMNLALEASIDSIDDKLNNRKGNLIKLTTALQFSADRGLFSRPVIRLFVTYADWGDEFKGLVGSSPSDAPYANDTQGWSIGAQTEVWW